VLSDRFQLSSPAGSKEPSSLLVLRGRARGEERWLLRLPPALASEEDWSQRARRLAQLEGSAEVLEASCGTPEDLHLGLAPGQPYLLLDPAGDPPEPPSASRGWDAAAQGALLDQALAHLAQAEELGLELGALVPGGVWTESRDPTIRFKFASLGPRSDTESTLQAWTRGLAAWIRDSAWADFLRTLEPDLEAREARRRLWRRSEEPTSPEWEGTLEELSRRAALSGGARRGAALNERARWVLLRAPDPLDRAQLLQRLALRLASAGLDLTDHLVLAADLLSEDPEARAEHLRTLRRVLVSERGLVVLGLAPDQDLPRRGYAPLVALSPPEEIELAPSPLPGEARPSAPRARDPRRLWRLLSLAPAGLEPELAIRLTGLGRAATEAAHAALCAGGWALDVTPWRLCSPATSSRLDTKAEVMARSLAHALREEAPEEPSEWSLQTCENLARIAELLPDPELAQVAIAEAIRRDRGEGALWSALARLEDWAQLAASRAPEERVPLWRELGQVRAALGDPAGAAEALATALATRSLPPGARAELHLERAQHLLRLGEVRDAGEAVARAEKALARDPEAEATRLGWLRRSLAVQVALKGGQRQRALELARDALEVDPDPRGQASFVNLRGLAELHLGQLQTAEASFKDALERCRALGLSAGVSACLSNLALQADHAGALERAEALHLQALERAEQAGLAGASATARANLGNLANRRGRLRAAEAHYQSSMTAALERGDEEALCLALCALSDVARGRGEAILAASQVERAAAFTRGLPGSRALVASNRAEAALALERLPEARTAATRVLSLREGLSEPAREARAAALLARIEVRAGDHEASRAALARANTLLPPLHLARLQPGASEPVTTVQQVRHPEVRAWIELARSELARSEGANVQASQAAANAQRLARRAGALRLEGRATLARAEALAAQEPPPASAQESAREAARLSAAAGAEDLRWAAELLEDLLALRADTSRASSALERARAAGDFALARGLVRLRLRATRVQWAARQAQGDEQAAAASARTFQAIASEAQEDWSAAARERYGSHPDLRLSGPAPGPAPPLVPVAEPAPVPNRAQDLDRSLAAARVLLAADEVWIVRASANELELVAGDRAPAAAAEVVRAALSAQAPHQAPGWLALPLQRGAAVFLASRSEAFEPAELQAACGVGLAIARHLSASEPAPSPTGRYGLYGSSPRLREVVERLERFAPYPLPVWIQGESGTGKELVARALHAASGRAGPWVAINLGALAEDLLSAELFGAERGAYTGAHETRRGVFELAHEGTLFLDEVADASPAVQAALLRVLETGSLRRVGGATQLRVDVRVLCASHRDLAQAVSAGQFREDLFYRLTALELRLPALRERPEDIAFLTRHFLAEAQRSGRGVGASLSPAALRALEAHPWPGNVRELRNAVERSLAVAQGPLLNAADFGLASDAPRPEGSLATLEREAIEAALAEHATLTAAAKALGINRRTLGRRMERHGIQRPR
jgi:DNA-binding NtrC family response regulator/tetratricopeptide (TPR) repeat protein